jgi:hypothetical protein
MTAQQLIAAAAACVTCGKEHEYRKLDEFRSTWAAADGHSYSPRMHAMANISAGPVINALRQLAAG